MSENEVDETAQTLKLLTNWQAYLSDEDRVTLGEILERTGPRVHEQASKRVLGGLKERMKVTPPLKLKKPGWGQT